MNNQEQKVCLYIATHNKTGLKYFGKTTRYFTQEDLQKYYHGSGLYWKSHLDKHGDDVTMEIYGIYKKSEVKEIAIKFSEENNIVSSLNESGKKIWANEKNENGLDGGTNKGWKHRESTKNKIKLSSISSAKKGHITRKYKIIDGKNGIERFADSRNKTINSKEYKNKLLDIIQKRKITMNATVDSGLTKFKEASLKASLTKRMKNSFDVFDLNGKLLFENLNKKEIKKINAGLLNTNLDIRLGSSIHQKVKLNTANKLHMIGWYILRHNKDKNE